MTDDSDAVPVGPGRTSERRVGADDQPGRARRANREDAGRPERRTGGPDPDPATRPVEGRPRARRLERFLLDVVREVTAAGGREAAERTACERLVAGPYRSAWVGVRDTDGRVALRVGATADDGGSSPTVRDAADGTTDSHLWRETVGTGRVQVATAVDCEPGCWPVPECELADGTVAALPVGTDAAPDALLAVHTERPNAFHDGERDALDALAAALGGAVDAAVRRDLLVADPAVELELGVSDRQSFLVRAAADHDCEVALEEYAETADGWRLACDITGCDPETVAVTAARDPAVADWTTGAARADGGRLVVETAGQSLVDRAASVGTVVRAAVADRGTCRLTLALPASVDVRETVAHLRASFPSAELRSRSDVRRSPVETPTASSLLDELTDRQRETLGFAYRAGYFEWPRERTAEEVAADLEITSATLHWHLRAAQRRLFAALFE